MERITPETYEKMNKKEEIENLKKQILELQAEISTLKASQR